MTTTTNNEIEALIQRLFEENFEALRAESGRSLAPDVKVAAFQQVLLYWQKLSHIATKVTDTEVKLNLPNLETPRGRKYGIEGVVDIVREAGKTTMYDIKTHDLEAIKGNLSLYEEQLNVYAHIWQHLRGQELDETAVISTNFPDSVKDALRSGDDQYLAMELAQWDPVVPIPFDEDRVLQTIEHFGEIVDAIEDGAFTPPTLDKLYSKQEGQKAIFASSVCVNCDARYSCEPYRAYARKSRRISERKFNAYLADETGDNEETDRIIAGLDVTQSTPNF